ncbi:2401_t:CDS:2, partial [Gigaspora rosea]
SLNIEHQFETTNNLKEIDNEIEIQKENWPEIQQNFDLNCGYKNGDSILFDNDQFTSLTNNLEDSVIEPPRLFINGENQSTSSTLIENSIKLSKKDFDYMLDPQQILFTQAQINSYFLGDDGFTVKDTINDFVTGRLKPQDLPIICICLNEDNQYISADNRRLY